jgi:hypothetical protein
MSPEAQKLARVLLDHQRKVRQPLKQTSPDVKPCLIVYGDLCERAGLAYLKPNVGKFLREVAQWCHDNDWPPLNALAVNHDTLRPGRGYASAPGCSREHWEDEVKACIEFIGYRDLIS